MLRVKFRNKKIDQNIRKKHKIADDEKLKKSKQIMGIGFSTKSLNRLTTLCNIRPGRRVRKVRKLVTGFYICVVKDHPMYENPTVYKDTEVYLSKLVS